MKVYMLAFECFEQRWKFPKAYHLFYDQFFKAAMGDKKWKENLEDGKPFGNSNTEAFALMCLKNNYHAWMAQANSEFDFENQYQLEIDERKRQEQQERAGEDDIDSDDGCTRRSILDEILPNIQYCRILQQPNEEEDDEQRTASYAWTIVTPESDLDLYKKAEQECEGNLAQARLRIKDSDLQDYLQGVDA